MGVSSRTKPEKDFASSALLLLGTVHGDPKGFTRLTRFLTGWQPDLILLELSPYARSFRLRHQRSLQRLLTRHVELAAGPYRWNRRKALAHPQILAIRRQLALPFEYRATSRYARQNGKKLLLVDYSPFSRKLIAGWKQLLTVPNLAQLLCLPVVPKSEAVEHAYRKARRLLEDRDPLSTFRSQCGAVAMTSLWREREHCMVEKVRDALSRRQPAKAVYVGGWQHLAAHESPSSLRDHLMIGASRCLLLDRC
jgi:hypothetical protein